MIHYQTADTILAFTTERRDAIPEGMILPVQTHSCHVAVVRDPMANYPDTDALLTEAGVPAGQIEVSGLCTYTNTDRFFSARQEGIGTGRLVSGIVRKR